LFSFTFKIANSEPSALRSNVFKISTVVASFVVHISRKLLVTLFKEMPNMFTVKGFILVKSESLLPSVAKVWVGFHFKY